MAVAFPLASVLSWGVFLLGAIVPIYIAFGLIGLTGFRQVTRYERNSSFYYNLNPGTKLLALFMVAVSTSFASIYLGLLATGTILLSYATLSRGKAKLRIGVLLTVAVVWGTAWGGLSDRISFLIEGTPFGGLPSFFYGELTRVIAADVAVSGVFLLALVLVMTSTPSAVMRALRKIRIPNPVTFSIMVGMKAVPTLLEAVNSTVKVQFMRGFGARGSRTLGPLYTIAAVLFALLPALIFLLRGARNTAISTGTRAFGAHRTRTYTTSPPFGPADVLVIALAVAFLAAAVIF